MKREVSQVELSGIIGITTRQIHNLEREGLPHRAERRNKYYPLPGAVEWYMRRKQDEARAETESTDFEEARARREAARARLAELEVARVEGKLIPRDVVENVYGDRLLDVVRSSLLNMPGRWGAQVVGIESPREGQALLKRVSSEILEELSGAAADDLESDGDAGLPDDFPGRDALAAAGVESVAELVDIDDLRGIPGIGPATERKIREALEGGRAA